MEGSTVVHVGQLELLCCSAILVHCYSTTGNKTFVQD